MKKKSQKQFIEEVEQKFPNMYDFSKVQYVNSKTKVILICKKCGYEWLVTPGNLLNLRHECPKCNRKMKDYYSKLKNKKSIDFIRKSNLVHKDKYSYNKVNYINNYTKVIITCPIHGDFEQTPNHHLQGQGCPVCNNICSKSNKRSKGELTISHILKKYNITFREQVPIRIEGYSKSIIVDFVIYQDNKIYYIEYNGKQHYVPIKFFGGELKFQEQIYRDKKLSEYCIDNNIFLIEIKYDLRDGEIEQLITKKLGIK